jgi:hypothetical protein
MSNAWTVFLDNFVSYSQVISLKFCGTDGPNITCPRLSTTPSILSSTCVFVGLSSFLLFVYNQTSRALSLKTSRVRLNDNQTYKSTRTSGPAMDVQSYSKPADGQVTVSEILIHPIKVRFACILRLSSVHVHRDGVEVSGALRS